MTWRVIVDVGSKDDADSVLSLIDAATQTDTASVLENVGRLHLTSFEVCEVDFMAGQICQLPAGHLEQDGTPHA